MPGAQHRYQGAVVARLRINEFLCGSLEVGARTALIESLAFQDLGIRFRHRVVQGGPSSRARTRQHQRSVWARAAAGRLGFTGTYAVAEALDTLVEDVEEEEVVDEETLAEPELVELDELPLPPSHPTGRPPVRRPEGPKPPTLIDHRNADSTPHRLPPSGRRDRRPATSWTTTA